MDTKQLQLVTFEQAVRLKRSGFDWECDHLYVGDMYVRAGGVHFPLDRDVDSYSNWNDSGYDWSDSVEKEWISAPTVALALKYIRKIKGINCYVVKINNNENVGWSFRISPEDKANGYYDTDDTAESALLDAVLDKLENEEKQ